MLLTSANKVFLIYDKIQNKKVDVEEKTNKRGHANIWQTENVN